MVNIGYIDGEKYDGKEFDSITFSQNKQFYSQQMHSIFFLSFYREEQFFFFLLINALKYFDCRAVRCRTILFTLLHIGLCFFLL